MTIEKLQPRKTKRPMPAREMVAKFKVSERSVVKWWSQPRADYLAENSISSIFRPLVKRKCRCHL